MGKRKTISIELGDSPSEIYILPSDDDTTIVMCINHQKDCEIKSVADIYTTKTPPNYRCKCLPEIIVDLHG